MAGSTCPQRKACCHLKKEQDFKVEQLLSSGKSIHTPGMKMNDI
jgi:hypothetical protein